MAGLVMQKPTYDGTATNRGAWAASNRGFRAASNRDVGAASNRGIRAASKPASNKGPRTASNRSVGAGHLHDALGSQALLEKDAADSGVHCAERIIQQHDVST